jgi:AAA domain/Primase C terminal 2 (PriCT-2)
MTPLEQQHLFFNELRNGLGFVGWKAPDGHYQQAAFETISEALALIAAHRDKANIWCAMAGFSPDTSRDAVNAVSLQSFWLDVDAHGKGTYETPDDALNGIKGFVKAAALPKPNYIHMTGHGVQVFWTLPEPISTNEWQPVADGLQELAKRINLGADPITADAARILRVPGTFNFRNPDSPVEAVLYETKSGYIELEPFHAAINAALSKLPEPAPKPKKRLPTGIPDTPENIALVKAMLAVLDPDSEYPDWRDINWGLAASGLSVAEDLARDWSAKGADWNEDAFNTVWNSYDPDREKAVGFGTLVFKAREAGYTGDIPQAEEKFDKLEFKSDTAAKVTIASKGLVTQRASDIEPEQVEWLIEGAIPMGMLVVIGGQPGMGKSQIAIKLAAAITTGEGLPDV